MGTMLLILSRDVYRVHMLMERTRHNVQVVIPVFSPPRSPQHAEEQGAVSRHRTEGNPGDDAL